MRMRSSSRKSMNWLGYFYRGGGSIKGPGKARDCSPRAFAMPCTHPFRWIGPRPDRHARPVQPCQDQRDHHARIAAAPDRGGSRRSAQRSPPAARQGAREPRAVAHRPDPLLRPARRQRRLDLRLRLAQPQATEAEILSGAGQAEAADRPGQPAAPGYRIDRAAAAVDPAVGDRQQVAAAAGDGGHRARPAAAQALEGRPRSLRRGR